MHGHARHRILMDLGCAAVHVRSSHTYSTADLSLGLASS
jgi:hypothetical protein